MTNNNEFFQEFKKIEWALFQFDTYNNEKHIIKFVNPSHINLPITYSEPDNFASFDIAFQSALGHDLDGLLSREALEFFSLITLRNILINNPTKIDIYKPHIENLTTIIQKTPDHKERIKVVLLKPDYFESFKDAFGVLFSHDMGFSMYTVNYNSFT